MALEESSLAQDFTSLLLSSVRPAAGGASLSPALKAAVPLGALGASKIAYQPEKTHLVYSIGWKKAALEQSSRTLLAAADTMSAASGGITKFIKGVLEVRSSGWGIVQMPFTGGEPKLGSLKVLYGFQKGFMRLELS
jgi:mediator of RNA polymerase II transcription subunit 17, fungi type